MLRDAPLSSAILPHHTKWFQLFEQLRFIVIDEAHTYRGIFGSRFTANSMDSTEVLLEKELARQQAEAGD